jgi:D-tyrosyl-tRNA(Tyr) deacylase
MRAVVQRVTSASVAVEGEIVGAIDHGLLVLLGVETGDGPADAEALANKLAGLRIFADEAGKMNLDVGTVGGAVLVVSQFTLGASLARGRRPSFNRAAPPEVAHPLVRATMQALAGKGLRVEGGRFGAHMRVELLNDGPVTLVVDVHEGKVL